MLRFHPCTVGFACIDVACEANGFDVTPLRVGLAARGIVVEVCALQPSRDLTALALSNSSLLAKGLN